MKFKTKTDTLLFLIDVGMFDQINVVSENYEPSEELVESFLKKRRKLVDKIKDFRKSQQTKQSWKHNRKKYMDGIKDFHRSTDGKRFHRNLGRFLATRITNEHVKAEYNDLVEYLKSLSSLPTHMLIELSYYKTTEQQASYEELLDEAFPIIYKVLNKMYYADFNINESDLDLLLRLVDTNTLISCLKEKCNDLDEKALFNELYDKEKDKSFQEVIKSFISI